MWTEGKKRLTQLAAALLASVLLVALVPINVLATEETIEVEGLGETTSSAVPDSSDTAEEGQAETGEDESTPPPDSSVPETDVPPESDSADSAAEAEPPASQPVDSLPSDSQPAEGTDSSAAPGEAPPADSEENPEGSSAVAPEEDPDADEDDEDAPEIEPEEDPDEEGPPVDLEAIPGLSGGGYGAGGNERFMAPISAPVSGSTPIATAADLRKIGKEYPMNGNYHLTADINLAGEEWVPIGSGKNYFMGTLDGQGYVIRNMTITSAEGNIGLIGQTIRPPSSSVKVALKNIGLEDVNINVTKGGNIGALLGDNARGHVTISNCYVTGSIKGTGTSVYAGGLVGTSIGYNPGGLLKISDCYSAAEISATGTTFDGILEYSPITVMGKAFAGGILARAHDAETITNCHNIGKITTSSTGVSMAGGITAILSNGAISTCSNTAVVSATSSFATDDSDNMFTTKYINAAGILAFNVTDNKMTTITGCYNAGDISATLTTTKTDKTDIFAGGIGGRTHKQTVSDCYNTGNVSAGNADGSLGYAGGIVGRNSTGSYVQRCYSTGAISGANPGAIVGLAMEGSNTRASYWLSGAAAAGVAEGTGATTARTAEEMTGEAAFSGFSFVQNWAFKPAENSGYPVLRVFHPGLEYTPEPNVPGPSREFLAAIEPPKPGARAIRSAQDLIEITNMSWDYYLTTNIDLQGVDWTPIGTTGNPFTGSFDGQGYVIRNLNVSGEIEHAGLFGYIGGLGTSPVIKNVALENVRINTTAPSLQAYVGAIVGYSFRTTATISNCYVTGSITSAAQNVYAGGIIGYSESSGGNMSISDCYNGADVTAEFRRSNSSGATHAGGIIAVAYNAKTIINCHNTGDITVTAVDLCSAGGIAGSLPQGNELISNCSNTGKVSARTEGGTVIGAGGMVGRNDGSLNTDMGHITNCWNTGDISVYLDSNNTSTDVFAGGIGGRTHQNAVSDCYNTGNILATSKEHLNGTAGGILGRNSTESSVRRCYNTGDITASQRPGAIIGLGEEGGFVWACYWNSDAVQVQDSRTLAAELKKGVGFGEDTTTPRTAEQMKQEPSFDHLFSFLETWGFKEGENSGYPVLRVAHPSLPYVSTAAAPVPERNFTVPASEIEKPAEDSIPISTWKELDDIRSSPEKMKGKYHLTADIDLNGVDWEPIGGYTHGNSNEPFTGVLDGQGYVITGLTTLAYAKSTLNRFGGLFAYVDGNAVIKNLGLEDICIYTTGWDSWSAGLCAAVGSVQILNCYATGRVNAGSGKSTYGAFAGGLVGNDTGGKLEIIDCHSSVVITAKSDDALCAGGICGNLYYGRIYNCDSTGDVTATRFSSVSANSPKVGGITGCVESNAEVAQCSNSGKLSLRNGYLYGYAGGITAFVDETSKISASANTGDVTLVAVTDYAPTLEAGGIVGTNLGKVTDSYNRGNVTATGPADKSSADIYAGGIAGNNNARSTSSYTPEITRCYNTGSVDASNPAGIAGKSPASFVIANSYWNSDSPQSSGNATLDGRAVFTDYNSAGGLTTTQMKSASSFTGFDFTGVWNMASGQNDGFPVLRAKPTPYTVTMQNGSHGGTLTGGGAYAKGETVTITAGASPNTSYRFKEWSASSDKVVFANKNSANTTFTMLNGHVTITATYEVRPSFTLTITGGGATYSSYQVGKTVTVTASTLTGKTFREWTADGADIVFADKNSKRTTFVMPERKVTLEAVFDNIPYTVTVNSGTASGATAIYGETVTITADAPEAGKVFSYWSAIVGITSTALSDRNAAQTTFTMPARDVTVKAIYKTAAKGTQSAPSTPTLAAKTSTTVTLNPIAGAEYRRGTGSWQDSPVFTGLSPNTTYSFSARMKETDALKASYSSSSLSVRTDAETGTGTPTPTPIDPGAPDTEKAAADKNALTEDMIKGANPDKENVTGNVSLPATGTNGSGITWTSSHPDVVSATGVVTRPPAGQPDARVTLTATITNGGATETVSITLTVKAQEVTITGVKLAQSSIRLTKGQKVTIGAVVHYSDGSTSKALAWKSSNTKVATVKNGRITAAKNLTKNGTTTIIATAENGQSAKIKVTVLKKTAQPVKPTKVTISGAKKSLAEGKTLQLKAKVSPSTATGVAVTWKSSKASVLRVDASGKLTALKKGSAKITVKAGGKTASVTIKVTAKK